MEAEDYETLPTGNVAIHMGAGAIAGIMEHCLMYPFDTMKTRMQSLHPVPEARYSSLHDAFRKSLSKDGLRGTIRGVTAVIVGAGPAHAMYFAAYEGIKGKFGSQTNSFQNVAANAAAGCGATLLHDALMVPAEAIKQRMQMFNSPYRSCIDCMCKLYCNEGMRAFYRSFPTQVLMNLPFHASHIVMYEKINQTLNPSREYNPKAHMIAGAFAGAVASACTTPLDVCKTLLNTQENAALLHLNKTRVIGLRSAAIMVYNMQGFKGFFRGIQARVFYQIPGTAISWSVYELFKHYLTSRDKHEEKTSEVDLISTPSPDKSPHFGQGMAFFSPGLTPTKPISVERLRVLPVTASCSTIDENLLTK